MKKHKIELNRYIFLGIFFGIVLVSFLIIKPYLTALLTSVILAYICKPIYEFILKYLKSKTISALLVTLIILLVVVLPGLFIINGLTNSIQSLTSLEQILKGDIIKVICQEQHNKICEPIQPIINTLTSDQVTVMIESGFTQMKSSVMRSATNFILDIPNITLHIFIMFFVLYYLLKEGTSVFKWFVQLIPLNKKNKERITQELRQVTFAIIYGTVVVAAIQGILGGIGFYLLGFRNPVLLGVLVGIGGLIPFIGTGIVWFPVSLLKIVEGIAQGGGPAISQGVFMILWGILIVSTIDNFIRPKIISEHVKLHPALILLGLIGGLPLFGFVGIIIGPIALSLLVSFVDIYNKTK